MEEERSTFKFFRSFYEAALDIYKFDKESAADFLMALCDYALNGTESYPLSGAPLAMFKLVKPNLDASKKRSAAGAKGGTANIEANRSTALANLKQNRSKAEADSEALPKQAPKQDRSTPEAHSEPMKDVGSRSIGSKEEWKNESYIPPYNPPKGINTPQKRFVPPTLEEVAAYVKERGSRVDPQGFIDFYAMKGWMVGKTPMKDWKAACRNAEHWSRWDQEVTDRGQSVSGVRPISTAEGERKWGNLYSNR